MKVTALDKIIKLIAKGVLFTLPFFFLPFSTSFVVFNKVSLVIVSSLILILLFAIRTFITGKFPKFFKGRSFDYLILIYFGVNVLFTLFSSNSLISFFGEYGEWFPSLAISFSLTVFYFVYSAVFTKKDLKALYLLLSSGFLIAGLGSLFLYYSSTDIKYFSDSFFGSGSEIAVYGLIGGLFSVYFVLRDDFSNNFKYLQLFSFVVSSLLVYVTSSFVGLVILTIGVFILYLLSSKETKKSHKTYFLFFGIIPILLTALLFIPSRGILKREIIKNPELRFIEAFEVMKSAFKKSPFVGNGLGTELETFTINRPQIINNSIYSDNIFLRYFSDTFEISSTTGIIGIIFFIVLLFTGAKKGLFSEDDTNQKEKFWAGVLISIILLSSFFFSTGILLSFLIFSFLAFVNFTEEKLEENKLTNPVKIIVAISLVVFSIFSIYGYTRIYLADFKYKLSFDELDKNDGATAFNVLRDARKLNPYRSEYRRSLSQVEMALASLIADQGNLDEKAQNDVQILIQDAVANVKENTEKLNPNSTVEWQARGLTYLLLGKFISGTNELTLDGFNHAISLDPNNAHLREQTGNAYLKLDDNDSAIKAFDDAIKLKPNLFSARLSRAAVYLTKGQTDTAKSDLEYIITNCDPSLTTYESAKTILEGIK